jgi:hypothetical protein
LVMEKLNDCGRWRQDWKKHLPNLLTLLHFLKCCYRFFPLSDNTYWSQECNKRVCCSS